MSDELPTPEQYRTLADLIERRGREGCIALFKGWLILAHPAHKPVRIYADGRFDDLEFQANGGRDERLG